MSKSPVFANRHDRSKDCLDFYPTPPWAVRGLMKYILNDIDCGIMSVLEPACGNGAMAETLREYFGQVAAFDIVDRGYGSIADFMQECNEEYDWIITNPPFNLAEKFIEKSMSRARFGAAFFVRTSFLESVGRFDRLFKDNPPDIIAQFSERVSLHKGELSDLGGSAVSYCWMVWNAKKMESTSTWIPPCRKELEHESDYSRFKSSRL